MKFEVLSAVTWKPRNILQTLGFIRYPQQCEQRDENSSNFTHKKAGEIFKHFSCSKTNSSPYS